MSILKKKNKSELPTNKELDSLDGSVDELSRQTKELLKGFGDENISKEEPTPPKEPPKTKRAHIAKAPAKKKYVPLQKSSARSFDIIHAPVKRKLQASLRARPAQDVPELLPSHAGLSYNEKTSPADSKEKEGTDAGISDKEEPAIVHAHATGALRMATIEKETEDVSDTEVVGMPRRETTLAAEAAANEQAEDSELSADNATQPLSFESNAEEAGEDTQASSEDTPPIEEDSQPAEEVSHAPTASDAKDAHKQAEASHETSYTNTTSRSFAPKSYEPVEDQILPAGFDTDEYHPELHDWSKLNKGNHATLYILVLLLAAIAAILWFFSEKILFFQ